MSWMNKNTGVKAPTRTTSATGGGAGGFKNGDKANVTLERIEIKPADHANVIATHGEEGAANRISIMLRVNGTEDGKNIKRCVFWNLFCFSQDAARASRDAQYLATLCTLAEAQGVDGIYADIIESDEAPDDNVLADLIGVNMGIVVGVMDQTGGQQSEFPRAVNEDYVFEDAQSADVAQGSGRRRSRDRS